MKKVVVIIVILLSVVLITQCVYGKKPSNDEPTNESVGPIGKTLAEQNANAYIRALEDQLTMNLMNDPNYEIPSRITDVYADYRGEKPTSIDLTITKDIEINGNIIINGYSVTIVDNIADSEKIVKQ